MKTFAPMTWAVLLLLMLELAVVHQALRLPKPLPAEAADDRFSATRALNRLGSLVPDGVPHPVGSQANATVRDRIVADLESFGYEVEIQRAFSCGRRVPACAPVENILTRRPGTSDIDAVVLAAHYDSVPAGPGAADDGAGVVVLLEIARMLSFERPFLRPVVFLITDGEEAGLLGAEAFVNQHPWRDRVGIVINLEARGSSGPSLMFQTSEGNAQLIDAYSRSVDRPFSSAFFVDVYRSLNRDTDLSVFLREEMAGLNFAFIGNRVHYHTPRDSIHNLDATSVQHHGDNVLAAVRMFSNQQNLTPSTGNAAYADFLSRTVVQWPETWNSFLIGGVLIILLAIVYVWRKRGRFAGRQLLMSVGGVAMIVVLTAMLAMVLPLFVQKFTSTYKPWTASPMPIRVAIWSSALLLVPFSLMCWFRKCGFWTTVFVVWLAWWAVALVTHISGLEGVAAVVLIPLFCASLLFGTLSLSGEMARRLEEPVCVVSVLCGGLIAFPNAILIEDAVGFSSLGLGAIPIVMFLLMISTSMLPLLTRPPQSSSAQWWPAATVGIVVIIGTITAVALPSFSAKRPQRINIIHFEDRDGQTAHWIAVGEGGRTGALPEALAKAGLSNSDEVLLPWLIPDGRVFADTARPTTWESAQFVRLEERAEPDKRIVRARIKPSDGQRTAYMLIPANRSVDVLVDSQPVRRSREDAELNPRYERYTLTALPRAGVLIDFHIWLDGPATGHRPELTTETTEPPPLELKLITIFDRLPPGGRALQAARGDAAVPGGDGDVSAVLLRLSL